MGNMTGKHLPYDKEVAYEKWIADNDLPPMTTTQYKFARLLFEEESYELLSKFGNLDIVYNSIRKHLKP